jgi:hypothetical protein
MAAKYVAMRRGQRYTGSENDLLHLPGSIATIGRTLCAIIAYSVRGYVRERADAACSIRMLEAERKGNGYDREKMGKQHSGDQ